MPGGQEILGAVVGGVVHQEARATGTRWRHDLSDCVLNVVDTCLTGDVYLAGVRRSWPASARLDADIVVDNTVDPELTGRVDAGGFKVLERDGVSRRRLDREESVDPVGEIGLGAADDALVVVVE